MFTTLKKTKKLLLLALTLSIFLVNGGHGYAITNVYDRSIFINSSLGGVTTSHTFSFYFPIPEDVGSIAFEYCTDPIDIVTCFNPSGSDVSGAVLTSQSGETGFNIASTSVNRVVIGRPASTVGTQQNTYKFDNMVNPSDKGPFYIRISAYGSSDGTGTILSYSAVVGSITQGIGVSAEVPDILYFCAAVSIPTDCSDAAGNFIEFGILSSSATKFGTSQFMVGTNAFNGYTVTTNGPSMTSGTNQIAPVSFPDISRKGSPQFGLNLRANLNPLAGSDPIGGSGIVAANYSSPDHYVYQDGDMVASASGRSTKGLFTVTYIVNINPSQPAGVYNTTVTYVCTAGF
jgi:hypothetical protein